MKKFWYKIRGYIGIIVCALAATLLFLSMYLPDWRYAVVGVPLFYVGLGMANACPNDNDISDWYKNNL